MQQPRPDAGHHSHELQVGNIVTIYLSLYSHISSFEGTAIMPPVCKSERSADSAVDLVNSHPTIRISINRNESKLYKYLPRYVI